MHLWPSMRIRDSFKLGYLKNLEWNLNRMKSEKRKSSASQTLLDNEAPVVNGEVSAPSSTESGGGAVAVVKDIAMVLSCCYCCFCCGACLDEDQK